MRIQALAISVALGLGVPASEALAETCDLPAGETVAVSSVVDGETLGLADGREVRLLGVLAPAAPPDWEGADPWPFAVQARQELTQLVQGASVSLHFDARQERRGIWRSLTYQVRDAHDPKSLGYRRHTYQLVEGKVFGIGEGKTNVYINFAEDWREDFTVVIKRKRLPVLEAGGLDLSSLPGRRVRVRGWVEWWNGPMIEISHPQELEVLDPPPGAG